MRSIFVISAVAIYREGIAGFFSEKPNFSITGTACHPYEEFGDFDLCILDSADLVLATLGAFFIRMRNNKIPVVMIGLARDEDEVLACLEQGASGYVTKDDSLDDLLAVVIKTLTSGACVEPQDLPGILRQLRTSDDHRSGRVGEARISALTRREREVAGLVGNDLSNKEISMTLGISVHTTKHHVRSILSKLRVDRRSQVSLVLAGADRGPSVPGIG